MGNAHDEMHSIIILFLTCFDDFISRYLSLAVRTEDTSCNNTPRSSCNCRVICVVASRVIKHKTNVRELAGIVSKMAQVLIEGSGTVEHVSHLKMNRRKIRIWLVSHQVGL